MEARFGAQLREARQRLGLTQTELGGTKYSASYVSLIENGRRAPTRSVLKDLAPVLGLDVAVLESWLSSADDEAALSGLCLDAYQAWQERDFPLAHTAARHAAEAAAHSNPSVWWNMSFLAADMSYHQGDYEKARDQVMELDGHAMAVQSDQLAVKSKTFLSVLSRVSGDLADAVQLAEAAVKLAESLAETSMDALEAQMARIAALAEHGDTNVAWRYAQQLRGVVAMDELSAQMRGQIAWTIGNVAFAQGEAATGVELHQLSEQLLDPAVDLELWARFIRATASIRLRNGIADEATGNLMARAEMVGKLLDSQEIRTDLMLIRARWHTVRGEAEQVLPLLDDLGGRDGLALNVAGDVALMRGEAQQASGNPTQAGTCYLTAAKLFSEAGLSDRASEALTKHLELGEGSS